MGRYRRIVGLLLYVTRRFGRSEKYGPGVERTTKVEDSRVGRE